MPALCTATAALAWLRLHWAHLPKGCRFHGATCFLITFTDSENVCKHLQRHTCNFKHTPPPPNNNNNNNNNTLTTLPLHELSESPWVTGYSCPIEKIHRLISCNLAAQKMIFLSGRAEHHKTKLYFSQEEKHTIYICYIALWGINNLAVVHSNDNSRVAIVHCRIILL